MPCGTRYRSECLIRPFPKARLILCQFALLVLTSLLSSLSLSGPPRGPHGSALNLISKMSFRHCSLHSGPYQPRLCRIFPQTAPIVLPHSWIPGLNLTWARSNLGSQLTCMVGLSFLLRVILGGDSMRSLFFFSLLYFFFLSFSNPLFFPNFSYL